MIQKRQGQLREQEVDGQDSLLFCSLFYLNRQAEESRKESIAWNRSTLQSLS